MHTSIVLLSSTIFTITNYPPTYFRRLPTTPHSEFCLTLEFHHYNVQMYTPEILSRLILHMPLISHTHPYFNVYLILILYTWLVYYPPHKYPLVQCSHVYSRDSFESDSPHASNISYTSLLQCLFDHYSIHLGSLLSPIEISIGTLQIL
jgi:hypothetical protein